MNPESPFFFSHHSLLQSHSDSAFHTFTKTRLLVISGATGTGKTYLCRKIHEVSHRRRHPWVVHNAASFDENRFESQLFGHVKGAYSGAIRPHPGLLGMTREGTLCIEDLSAFSPDSQTRTLRFLEDRRFRRVGGTQYAPFNGGIMFTSPLPLKDLLGSGWLREDFYFRIQAAETYLWPFRDRPLDFDNIARSLIADIQKQIPSAKYKPTQDDLQALRNLDLPGNLHGLRNILLRSMVSGMPPTQLPPSPPPAVISDLPNRGSLKADLAACEKRLIMRALRLHPYSRQELADYLGISRRSLHYKLKKFDLLER